MNVWILNHYAVGPNSTGITRHFDLAKELVKLGHNVTIFAASFNHQKRIEEQTYAKTQYYNHKNYCDVNFYWIKTLPYKKNNIRRVLNMFSYTYKVNKLAKKIEQKPDIIIGSLMHPLAALLGYKLAKKMNAKFYFEERDLWPQSLIDLGKISRKNPLVTILSKIELFLYNKADKIIVLFDKAPEYVRGRGISSDKVVYLPNGVDLKRYNIENTTPSRHFKLLSEIKEKNKFLIIYTGAHSLANYLNEMLNIAKKIEENTNDIHFVLIGDGPEKQNLIKRVDEEGILNVNFLPAVQKEYIPSLLKCADAGIITMRDAAVYRWGVSLNKMYDYMAASLPIFMLANLQSSVIETENLGFITNGSNKLINGIIQTYKQPNKVEHYGTNALNYVENNHSWEVLAKQLSDVMLNED